MLDVSDFIVEKGGDPNKIRESQRRRYAPEEVVDQVITLFEDHRRTKYEASQVGTKINANQKEIGSKKKAKEDASELLQKKVDLEKEKKLVEELVLEKEVALQKRVKIIGNYVHESVPLSNNEDNNTLIRKWAPEGANFGKRDCLSHHEVLTRIDGYDSDRGVKIVGHRGYCLTGYGLFLNLALINYGLEYLWEKGYKPNQPPHFMLRDYMAKTAQLEQFDEELYKVTDDGEKQADKYLIATSEQPLSALHDGEWLQDKDLPIRYAGYSTCYRKEAGAHGKDAWGIFRVHQFEKIEQFLITKPEDSWQAFDDMIGISENFYQSLGLPYQVVAIVSGALNNAAAKKYDLEAWFPFQQEYKELVSCSNCTDYQTRALDIRYGPKGPTDGVTVPEVLRKYIPGAPEFIEYTKELPKNTTSQKNLARC
ncbi:Cytosolic seryl-tRNA synthetase [Sticta canariensis]|nr:Cytosolic seryl-tRNA synthetase [Sticta canariensis]